MRPHLFLHVDMDSPATLARFWRLQTSSDGTGPFYERAIARANGLFAEFSSPATYFCIGQDLKVIAAREAVRAAFEAGHEIANHTHSHSFSLSGLTDDALREEVHRCSDSICAVTGVQPVGFRAPGYAISQRLMRVLRELGFRYDSSALWTPATALMKAYHRVRAKAVIRDSYGETTADVPSDLYWPEASDWKRKGVDRSMLEIPLPRSPFGILPFYNSIHLMMPDIYRVVDVECVRDPHLVYLFHLIDFCDLSDEGIPAALKVHPNLGKPVHIKIRRMRDTLKRLLRRYKVERTDKFVGAYDAD